MDLQATQLEFFDQSQRVVYRLSFLFFSRLPHFVVYPVFVVAAATCGGRCGVLEADCRGIGRTILNEL